MLNHLSFQFFAWVGSILYALEVLGTKLLSKYEVKNPWLMNFGYSGLVMAFTVPLSLYYGASLPIVWGNIVLSGLFWAAGGVLYIILLYRMDLTTLSPLFVVRIGLTVLLGTLFLGEVLSGAQLFFIALMFFGSLLVTLDERMSFKSLTKGNLLLIVSMWLAFSLDAMFIKKSIADNGFWTATMWMFIISQLLLLPTIAKFKGEIKNLSQKAWWFIFFVGTLDFAATLAVNKAYEQNVSISSAIITLPLSGIMAFALSFIIPKWLEKHTFKVYFARLVGTALIVWAGIKLN